MRMLGTCLVLVAVAACSGSSTINITQSNGATSKEKMTAGEVKAFATMTPPANATSMGKMTSPMAGNVSIPITNVEVYVFQANVDPTPAAETLYWAADTSAAYVWGQIDVECVDDGGNPTGETGKADFIYEASADGYGWMTSTNTCGYATFYGCSAHGGGAEVCGGCDFNDAFIACVAS
jgi:hypothetical protein